MTESRKFVELGGWWEKGKEPNKIDMAEEDHAVAVEVKRQRKNFKPELLKTKVEQLKTKVLYGYNIEEQLLTLEDM